MEYISVKQAAQNWGISDRRVRTLCEQEKIKGVIKKGRSYKIPPNAEKPIDGRSIRYKRISAESTSLFTELDLLMNELNKRRPLTQGEIQRLQEEFLVEYTYNSNAIEGNTLTLQETAMVLDGITIDKKPLKDHLEAIGHRDAFLYVQTLVRENIPLSETVIKQTHNFVLMDRPKDKGVYRQIPVRIMGAFNEPPIPCMVPELMQSLIAEVNNKKKHPIESAALFHLNFEGIHPFIDGNGRTGRLMLNLFLMQNGYPSVNVKFSDRKKYYEAFDIYYREGSSSSMIKLITKNMIESVQIILDYLQ